MTGRKLWCSHCGCQSTVPNRAAASGSHPNFVPAPQKLAFWTPRSGPPQYYIDNESARMAFVKGSGETHFASHLINDFVCLEAQLQHKTWFGRCPSHSNPSDGASRLDLTWFEGKGASRAASPWIRWGYAG